MFEFVIDEAGHDGREGCLGAPAQGCLDFLRVTAERSKFDLSEKGFLIIDVVLPMEAGVGEGGFDELFDGMRFSGAEDIVIHGVVLEHLPETFDVFGSPAPIATGTQVA